MSRQSIEEFCPKDKKGWRKWLEANHRSKEGIWLIFHKQKSANYNLSWSESVDEALCFGWIDSTKKNIDEERYMQFFCKRKPKSNWSRVNKEKVKVLIESGLMRAQGHKSIEVAKQNGSWSFLDEVEALVIPQDLESELNSHSGAMEYFTSLSKSARKILLYWVVSAKREATRQKRVLEIAKSASEGLKPKQFR